MCSLLKGLLERGWILRKSGGLEGEQEKAPVVWFKSDEEEVEEGGQNIRRLLIEGVRCRSVMSLQQ